MILIRVPGVVLVRGILQRRSRRTNGKKRRRTSIFFKGLLLRVLRNFCVFCVPKSPAKARLPLPITAAAAALLTACTNAPDDTLFPLREGHHWSYRVTTTWDDGSIEPQVEKIEISTRGSREIAGEKAWKRTSSGGASWWLRQDASGIYRVATQGALDPAPRVDAAPRFVLKSPVAVGTEWNTETTTYVLMRRNEFPRELRNLARYRSLPIKYRITALGQSVDTSGGRFEGCVRVEGTGEIHLYADDQLAFRNVPFTAREWYCPRVGLVKLERSEPSPSKFVVGGTLVMELTGHE